MGLVVDFHQFPYREMGISLRRRETDMAKHFLNLPKICSSIQKMGGKGMAKAVRANFTKDG